MEAAQIKLKTFLECLLAILFLELVLRGLTGYFSGRPLLFIGAVRFAEIAAVGFILFFSGKENFRVLGIAPDQILPGIKRGLIWSAGFGLVAAAGMLIAWLIGINPFEIFKAATPKGFENILLLFLVGGIIAPVAEELLFRGVLFTFFRRYGFWAALIISTALFVLAHSSRNLPITQTVGSLVFAASYEIERKLMVPIVIHALGNMALFSLSFMAG